MSEIEKTPSVEVVLKTVVDTASENLPAMKDSTEKALAAFSGRSKIIDQSSYEAHNNLAVKIRVTLGKVKGQREAITKPMDQFKKQAMLFESKLDEAFQTMKSEMDAWAAEQARKKREEEEKIKRQLDIENEKTRLKKEISLKIANSMFDLIEQGAKALNNILETITLDTFEKKSKSLTYKPNLKQEVYEGWFMGVEYDKKLLSQENYNVIVAEIKEKTTFEKCNETYCEKASELLDVCVSKLPEKKAYLEKVAEMEKMNGEEAEKLKAQEAERVAKEKADRDAEIAVAKEKTKKEEEEKEAQARMDSEFEAQIKAQNIIEMDGVRKKMTARIDPEFEKNPVALTDLLHKVMLCCLTDANHKGIFKRDKSGFVKKDEKGTPEYIDSIQEWLTFFAKNCSMKIDGLILTEDFGTIAKAS